MKFVIVTIAFALYGLNSLAIEPKPVTGRDVYKAECLSCHGENGKGNGTAGQYMRKAPKDLTKDVFVNGDSEDEILNTLSNGLAGTNMPQFRLTLTKEQLKAVSQYVKSLRKN